MVTLLSKFFIKEPLAYEKQETREGYGILCGVLGIVINVILCIIKFVAGTISGSIAITADAANNLSDAGSSIITLLGFKLAAKKPDPDHPYGHGRLEYLSGLIVAMIIVLMGFELLKSAIDKIMHPSEVTLTAVTIIILVASILGKLYMYFYNKSVGKKINSAAMQATATDSISDCISTTAVLISAIVGHFTGLQIDGWCGLVVSGLVMYSGYQAAMETIGPMLGQAPDPEFVQQIYDIVESYPEVVGVHDLLVHDYGPGRLMITLHAEVPAEGNVMELHDVIDNIEVELKSKLKCAATIHMDPVMTGDTFTTELKEKISKEVDGIGENITIHDFRIVAGPTHTNILFDAVLPFDSKLSTSEAAEKIGTIVKSMGENYFPIVTIDRPYA